MYQGDYAPASTVVFNFNTASFADGSPITLAGTPALSVYKNSTTESTSGITLTVDYDSRTGMHHVVIDTSADGTFYATGTDFDVIITAGTVGGTSVVGRRVGSFSLNNRSALRPATAGRTLVVDASGLADANTVKVGPSGSGTAQTARDIGASVLLSSGTGTGQLSLSSGTVSLTAGQKVDVDTIKTNPVVNAGTVTFPTGATLASTTNITAGTITTATNLTNAPTAGDFTATMKTSLGTAVGTAQTGDSFARIGSTGSGLTSLAPSATALSTATWTGTLATNLGTLAGHDPGATLGTSTLTQTQVSGGAYALNSASFAFNSGLDFTTTQKSSLGTAQTGDSYAIVSGTYGNSVIHTQIAALNDFDPASDTVAHVTLVDTTTTNTDMRGTNGANTTTPDNTSIAAIKAKTDALPTSPAATGAAMALVDGAITEAKIVMPTETAGRPTGFLAAMRRGWEWLVNKRTRDTATGDVKLYGADGVTVLETQNQATTAGVDTQTQGS